jgi:hypothetical protein
VRFVEWKSHIKSEFVSAGPLIIFIFIFDEKLNNFRYGKLPWKRLFEPSIKLSRDGFKIPAELARRMSVRKKIKIAVLYIFKYFKYSMTLNI